MTSMTTLPFAAGRERVPASTKEQLIRMMIIMFEGDKRGGIHPSTDSAEA
ncbi:hypothetical protein J7E49_00585 [Variovorax paradoxus]|nr:hypothetical protein [Variovorax paradoxus]